MSTVLTIHGDLGAATGSGFAIRALARSLRQIGYLDFCIQPVGGACQIPVESDLAGHVKDARGGSVNLYLHPPPWRLRRGEVNAGWFLGAGPEIGHLADVYGRLDVCFTNAAVLAGEISRVAGTRGVYSPLPILVDEVEDREGRLPIVGVTHYLDGRLKSAPFILGAFGGLVSRSGVEDIVRAFYSEFTGSDNVILLLKMTARGSKRIAYGQIVRTIREIREKAYASSPAEVGVILDDLNSLEFIRLMRAFDVLVSASRWDPLQSAVLHGLAIGSAVIAPDYGQALGFWSQDECFDFCTRKEAVYDAGEPGVSSGQTWYVADVNSLRRMMRLAHKRREDSGMVGVSSRDPEAALRGKAANVARQILEAINVRV